MTDKSADTRVSTSEPGKTTEPGDAATSGALADAAWLLLSAFIVIFVISAVVSLIRSRKGPKQ